MVEEQPPSSILEELQQKPWQYDWKRPILSSSGNDSNEEEGVTTTSSGGGGMIPIDCKSIRLTSGEIQSILELINNNDCDDDANGNGNGKATTSSKMRKKKQTKDLHWDVDDDDDDGDDKGKAIQTGPPQGIQRSINNEKVNDQNCHERQYMLTVTLFASESSVQLFKMLQEKNLIKGGITTTTAAATSTTLHPNSSNNGNDHKTLDIHEILPADTIQIEIIQDSFQLPPSMAENFNNDNNNNSEQQQQQEEAEMGLSYYECKDDDDDDFISSDNNNNNTKPINIMKKTLQWPTSALIGLNNDEAVEDLFHPVEKFVKQVTHSAQTALHLLPFFTQHQRQDNLHTTTTTNNNNNTLNETRNDQEMETLQQKANSLRKRTGLKSVAFCRCPIKTTAINNNTNIATMNDDMMHHHIDMDEAQEILDKMAFGSALFSSAMNPSIPHDHNCHHHHHHLESHNESPSQQSQSELILSCLTNDGQLHLFDILDVLTKAIKKKNTTASSSTSSTTTTNNKSNKTNNILRVMKDKDENDEFMNEFESFLFGQEILSKLKHDILPLSHPIATIPLSVVSSHTDGIGNVNESSQDEINIDRNKNTASIDHNISSKVSYFDISFLNSNIEMSTVENQTIHNHATNCIAVDDYIAVSGWGVRLHHHSHDLTNNNPNSPIQSERTHERNSKTHQYGGFIAFISLKYFSEVRILFVPFIPKIISPVSWNYMKLLVVMGDKHDQSLAIRTDSSSYIPYKSHRYMNGQHHGVYATNTTSIDRFIKKFSILELSLDGQIENKHGRSEIDEHPLSVTSLSTDPAQLLYYSFHGSMVSLKRYEMTCLEEDDTFNDSNRRFTHIVCVNNKCQHVQIQLPSGYLESTSRNKLLCLCDNVSFLFDCFSVPN